MKTIAKIGFIFTATLTIVLFTTAFAATVYGLLAFVAWQHNAEVFEFFVRFGAAAGFVFGFIKAVEYAFDGRYDEEKKESKTFKDDISYEPVDDKEM